MGLRDVVNQRREQRKPKTLAELRAQKQANKTVKKPKTLAALRESKRGKSKQWSRAGLRYHNVRPHSSNAFWLIDVSNGDLTFTLHNRHGAWFHDIDGREGRMAEPVRVARALGTSVDQLEISRTLSDLLDAEKQARGIPTAAQLHRQHEEEAKAQRRKRKQEQ